MYGTGARRAGLGVMARCDVFPGDVNAGDPSLAFDEQTGCYYSDDATGGGVDPIALTPSVVAVPTVQTVGPSAAPGDFSILPLDVSREVIVAAPASAPVSPLVKALLIGVALYATMTLLPRRRR